MTKITAEMVKSWLNDGVASAVQEVNEDLKKIAAQMNAEISTNKSKTSRNTIRMGITIKLDMERRQVGITGSYGFSTPNLGDESNEIVREIPDPNQFELDLDDGQTDPNRKAIDATTPNPEEDEDEFVLIEEGEE